ncbi:hypothetical protein ATE84_2687 [Aquimarina sp. MAR_2010_214]|uniref:hypothetical protein n=1 Tax=Aquimarina sp. MAR_2010_214 TaxID=1250026 RepID=UPI000CA8575C|nr:hypothetical protein [Aquimarina sp. MAR_2010_214]PKV50624.1 hypothetical protein ATE84_2687 [Aquimarina sp. MAR_2010_214]
MKTNKLFIFLMIILSIASLKSCGPIVITSSPDTPPPPWFYPNRVETVRYVYFPDHNIYYDISYRHYIYFENNIWITIDALPAQYHYINLNRSRYVRIRDYHGNNIHSYHSTNRYYNHSRSTRSRYDRSRSSTRVNRSTTTRNRTNTTRSRDSIR